MVISHYVVSTYRIHSGLFEVLSQALLGGTDENHENPQDT
jgi:hypothetical protein